MREGTFYFQIYNTYSSTTHHIEANDGVLIMIHLEQAVQAWMDAARKTSE